MKALTLLSLLTSGLVQASTFYNCLPSPGRVLLRLEVDNDFMPLTIQTIQNNEVLFSGTTEEIREFGADTRISYTTYPRNQFDLTFKTSDLKNLPPIMYGFSHGSYGAGFVDSGLKCLQVYF